MLKIKVKFLHLCLLALVFIICIAFLYKDIYKLKNSLNLFQKTLEAMYIRVNHLESYNKLNPKDIPGESLLNSISNKSTANNTNYKLYDIDDVDDEEEDDDDDDEDDGSTVKSDEYQELLRHMSQLMDNDNDNDNDSDDISETNIEELDDSAMAINDSDSAPDTYIESIDENNLDEIINEDVSEPIENTIDESTDTTTSESITESTTEPITESFNGLVNESNSESITKPLSKSIEIDTEDIKVNIANKSKDKFTNKNLNLKTVNELKEILKNQKLSTKGNKKELISRIIK
jgi:hypothetical protein